jgi:cytochrome c oxidase accessory protein FixG
MCVQVCPTGIDIRDGLQSDCIGCAACVDACNMVMDKTGAPRGLIRYATENAMEKGLGSSDIRRRILRPRVLIYSAILLLIVSLSAASLFRRDLVKLDVIRDRGSMGREVEDGMIENVYRLQIMNTDERTHRYRISVKGIDSIALATEDEVTLEPTASRAVPVRVRIAHGKGEKGSNKIWFELKAADDERLQVEEKAVFIVPR